MNWRKRIAYGWLLLIALVVPTVLVYAIARSIWESSEPQFWLGFVAFIGITSWAVYELIPPVME